jgi:hypothetical protein
MRKIESLPEEQVYQVLDYIEFLESRYASPDLEKEAGGLQRLAEGIEDRLRNKSFNPSNLREAWQVVAAADRALSGVAKAGRQLLEEIAGAPGANEAAEQGDAGSPAAPADETDSPDSEPKGE